MRDLKIKEVQVVQNVNGTEKIPVSNGSGQPAVITVNLILDKVDNKISEVIDGAPETLDTLKEIADIIENNADIIESVANKADKEDVYTKEELDNAIDITYAELVALRDSELLRTGACYKITDYETMVDENLLNTSLSTCLITRNYFKLIVRAISNKELDQRAFATDSTHSYFTNEIMSKWLIWYSLDNDTNLYSWANANGKGVIYRLIDERNNDVDFDFKSITFYGSISKESGNIIGEFSVFTKWNYTGDDNTITLDYLTSSPCKNNTIKFGNSIKYLNYRGEYSSCNTLLIYGNNNNWTDGYSSSRVLGNGNVLRSGSGANTVIGSNNIFDIVGGSTIIGSLNILEGSCGGVNIKGSSNHLVNCGGVIIKGDSNNMLGGGGSPITGSYNTVNNCYASITGDHNICEHSGGTIIEGDYNVMTGSTGGGSIKGSSNKVHNANVTIDGHNNDISGSGGQVVTGDFNKISGGTGGNTIKGSNNTITGTSGGNNITGSGNIATQTNCTIVGSYNNVTDGGGHRVEGDLNTIRAGYSLVFGDVNEINSPDSGSFYVYGNANKFEPRTASITVYGNANKFEPECTGITLGDSDSRFNNCRILTGTKSINVIDRLNRGGISNVTINLPRQYPTSGSLTTLNVYPEKYNENQHSGTSTITFDDDGNIFEYTPEDFLQLNKRRFTMIVNVLEDLVGKELALISGEIGGDPADLQRLLVDGVEVNQGTTSNKAYYAFTTAGEHKVTIWFDLDVSMGGWFGASSYEIKVLDFTDTDFSLTNGSSVWFSNNSTVETVIFNRTNFGNNGHSALQVNLNESLRKIIFSNCHVEEAHLMSFACNCPNLQEVIFENNDMNVTQIANIFGESTSLKKVVFDGDFSKAETYGSMFNNITTNGTLYYNGKYDFSKIIEQLPETWIAIDLNTGLKYGESIVTDNAIDVDAEDGVYILDSNNNLVTTSEWNTENTALGVAVIDGVNKFVIAKLDATAEAINWGEDEVDSSLRNYITVEAAASDINGVYNTSKLYKNSTNAASYCGGNTYLGSAGEWISVLNNLEAVNAALELIEGSPLDAESYWTSTEYDAEQAWRITPSGLEPSSSLSMVRPFIALGAPLTTRVKLLELKVLSLNEFESLSDNNVITGTFTTETENLEVLLLSNYYDKMVIDGKEVSTHGSAKFIIPNIGNHTVKYYLVDNPGNICFNKCALKTVDLSKLSPELGKLNWNDAFKESNISNVNFYDLEINGSNNSIFRSIQSDTITISNLRVLHLDPGWFYDCTANTIILDNVNFLHCDRDYITTMFSDCINLTKIVMNCPIKKGMSGLQATFSNIPAEGTFYYNGLYDYSEIIKYLPEGWTAIDLTTMSNYATKDEIPTDYITEIPAEYVTEDELTAKGYLTEHLDISGKQDTISDLEDIRNGAALGATAIQEHQSLADYALKSELPDTSNLATKDEIPTDYLTTIPEAATDTLGGVKKITVDTLADDADIATVVAAYNNLVNKLIESGLAATLLDA